MAALIALVLTLWGTLYMPHITVEFFQNDIGAAAQTGCPSPGECIIAIDEPQWDAMTPARRQSLLLHEVGHTLGLGHYGSCNANVSVMGCWVVEELTGIDHAELDGLQIPGHRLIVPMVAKLAIAERGREVGRGQPVLARQ
jgi:hypothetical protein